MDFQAFKNSLFYKVGITRFNLFARQAHSEYFAMYHANPIPVLSSQDPHIEPYYAPKHRKIPPFHLYHALAIQAVNPGEADFLPQEFREVISKQWIEVMDMCNTVLNEHNKDITDPKDKLRLNTSGLLITEPGMTLVQHIHEVPQTLTIVYRFQEEKLPDTDPAHFLMGKAHQHKVYVPDADKVAFALTDDPPHHVYSPEWRFWWYNDFNKNCDIPNSVDAIVWDSPYLDSKNL